MPSLRPYLLFFIIAGSLTTCAQTTVPPAATTGDTQSQPAAVPSGPTHVGSPVLPPKIRHSANPKYTDEARREKISGNVQIYLWVDEKGNPSHIKVIKSLGHGLDESAVDAVRKYKFKPATRDGVPVKVDLYIDVNFQIRDRD